MSIIDIIIVLLIVIAFNTSSKEIQKLIGIGIGITFFIAILNRCSSNESIYTKEGTYSYTKIANDGSELPETAKLGTGTKDWACTKDNKTGLIWEVKTTDGGLRDWDNYYTWYNPDKNTNNGNEGVSDIPNEYRSNRKCSTKDNCNTYDYTNSVNQQGLCGANDWRIPTNEELLSLIYCSSGQYQPVGQSDYLECKSNQYNEFTINKTYFPNTTGDFYSSSFLSSRDNGMSPLKPGSVDFTTGSSFQYFPIEFPLHIRLVRKVIP